MKGKEHFQFPKYCSILPLPCVIRSSQCLLSYYCCISKKDLCLKSYTISIHTSNAIKWFLFKIDYKNIFVSQRSSSIDDTDGPNFHQISDCLISFKTAKSKKSVTSQLQNDMWYGINLGCFEIHKLFLDFTFFPPSVWTVIWAVRIAAAPKELWNINDVDHIFFSFCSS